MNTPIKFFGNSILLLDQMSNFNNPLSTENEEKLQISELKEKKISTKELLKSNSIIYGTVNLFLK
jgi:hypothetical protein